jgi:hypothetical protein
MCSSTGLKHLYQRNTYLCGTHNEYIHEEESQENVQFLVCFCFSYCIPDLWVSHDVTALEERGLFYITKWEMQALILRINIVQFISRHHIRPTSSTKYQDNQEW